ncbi:phosphoribosylglycinamide formyltransferase [Thermithiobacillus tepidarius DSM 3134]|uniref:phosphoribosylglycinamide formyltransferase n=1 Tax=Thermithiobacillus tepidarius TaxID=929 RepID=UPI00042497CF|nr:phosphoribosylglycinamide formyltransferase [Thermithiobacillus tepidarius]
MRIVALVSGRGSNLQAILDAVADGAVPAELAAVVSNVPGAYALERAARSGVPTAVLRHRNFPDRAAYDAALAELIDGYRPDLVVLAGFMRLLTPAFVARYHGRLVNIHPSLLPAFPGLHTHRRALEQGVKLHGATVHFVSEDVDAGPIIIQAAVPVLDDDTPESLAERVLAQEHRIYPQALAWIGQGLVRLEGTRVRFARPLEADCALIWPPSTIAAPVR